MYQLLEKYFTDRTDIDKETFEHIASFFKLIKTKRNELLLTEGQTCKHYYFVNKGCLRIFNMNKEGIEGTRYLAFEGAFGTALPSFIEQTPAFEFIQTIEKSELLVIRREHFLKLIDTVPQFASVYRQILEASFIKTQKRIYGFQGLEALEQLKWVMKNHPKLLTRVSNKIAASYLGIAPSTLSRLKSKL